MTNGEWKKKKAVCKTARRAHSQKITKVAGPLKSMRPVFLVVLSSQIKILDRFFWGCTKDSSNAKVPHLCIHKLKIT